MDNGLDRGSVRKMLVTADIVPQYKEKLQKIADVEFAGWIKTGILLSEEEQIASLKGVDVYLVGYEHVGERVIAEAKALRLVACARANPVNVDAKALAARNIPLLYTPGRNAVAAAEFTLGVMLCEARHIARSYHALRSGKYLGAPSKDILNVSDRQDVVWNLSGDSPYKLFHGFELSGKTLGLLGLGHIGRLLARYARAFDMRILAYDPYLDKTAAAQAGVELTDLDTVYGESDFLSLHCKVTEETVGMVDSRAFGKMKKNVVLINTARASIIDQAALLDALKKGRIAGAALDVFWNEPLPSNHPLLSMDNVTLTPHLAGASFDVPLRHSQIIVEDILRWASGQVPRNVWNVVS